MRASLLRSRLRLRIRMRALFFRLFASIRSSFRTRVSSKATARFPSLSIRFFSLFSRLLATSVLHFSHRGEKSEIARRSRDSARDFKGVTIRLAIRRSTGDKRPYNSRSAPTPSANAAKQYTRKAPSADRRSEKKKIAPAAIGARKSNIASATRDARPSAKRMRPASAADTPPTNIAEKVAHSVSII